MSVRALKPTLPLLLALALGVAVPQAQASEPKVMTPAEMSWTDGPPTLPSGVQMIAVSGSPKEKGPFVLRLKFPAGYEVPAHMHSTAEFVTVMSGTLNFGHGEVLDRNASRALSEGGFVHIPADHPHFVWTAEQVVVQIHGEGPFTIKYLNPADDPQKKQALR